MNESTLQWQVDRYNAPLMEYYRDAYKGSKRILSGLPDLSDKHVVIYFEQGAGDTIQLLRYVPHIKAKKLTLHCIESLHSLVRSQWDVNVLDRSNPDLPDHDWHILSMDLPLLMRNICNDPYIHTNTLNEVTKYDSPRLGVAHEGNPSHPGNMKRSCPLKLFKGLAEASGAMFFLQPRIHLDSLIDGCESMKLLSEELNDFLDTAKLINSLDVIVTVDTSVLHLAGAIGKKTYGLLSHDPDPRWGKESNHTPWYPSVKFIRQPKEGDWESVFTSLSLSLT